MDKGISEAIVAAQIGFEIRKIQVHYSAKDIWIKLITEHKNIPDVIAFAKNGVKHNRENVQTILNRPFRFACRRNEGIEEAIVAAQIGFKIRIGRCRRQQASFGLN